MGHEKMFRGPGEGTVLGHGTEYLKSAISHGNSISLVYALH
ncbi:Uncharacterized protein ToN1_45940 [Aromatoleum petrolei]|nr:Uncharacterized protein ToN1_45940 [Aromatoleum petrolei]